MHITPSYVTYINDIWLRSICCVLFFLKHLKTKNMTYRLIHDKETDKWQLTIDGKTYEFMTYAEVTKLIKQLSDVLALSAETGNRNCHKYWEYCHKYLE